ncbi:MAG: hypothetical protein ACON5B_10025 [Myxococcota bacterium]
MWWMALVVMAWAAPPVERVVTEIPVAQFELSQCEGVRMKIEDVERLKPLLVTFANGSDQPCAYKGVVLKGFLEGGYRSIGRAPDAPLTIAPGAFITLEIKPTLNDLPPGDIELQIPPERGTLVLIGRASTGLSSPAISSESPAVQPQAPTPTPKRP